MKKPVLFDVLVVYTEGIAVSASSNKQNKLPFSVISNRARYNVAYAYFLKICLKNNIKAAFTTSDAIIGKGKCSNYWIYQKDEWIKVNKECYSRLIFDKFSPINKKQIDRRLRLLDGIEVKPFNDPILHSLFFDKLKTYQGLKTFTIPTVSVKSEEYSNVEQSVNNLHDLISEHSNQNDFSRKYVLKDRFGAGGNSIFCIDEKDHNYHISRILSENKNTQFVIQPFLKFKNGYTYKSYIGFIDIRIIYLEGEIIQAYIRVARKNEFRCNEHKGGALEYIPLKDLPKKILSLSDKLTRLLNSNNTLYALDFVVSDSGNVYLMEGNTGPGIDWNLSLKKNERMAKKLIRLIVENLADKVKPRKPKIVSRNIPVLSALIP